jgi:hypothetical protein
MKIEGPKKSGTTKTVSRPDGTKSPADSSFSGLIDDASETPAQKPASGVMSISQLDALLSVQEAGNASDEAGKKGRQRAEALLAQLDRVRLGLLTGGIPIAALQQMEHMISAHRDRISDPRLAEILDEIDLRVQVELAKHHRR